MPLTPDRLAPFLFTVAHNLPHLHHLDTLRTLTPHPLHTFLADHPDSRPFGLLLNASNQLAFGGGKNMGMPLWVLLDCGLLSSGVLGFGISSGELSDEERAQLHVPPDYEGLVPVSEYCACPTLEPHCVSGFSLQSQLPGHALGMRTKAMALLAYGARHQVGVTQFDNPSIRVHARFGPLTLSIHRPSIHTHAANSFVYRVDLPSEEHLAQMARGALEHAPFTLPQGEPWRFSPREEEDHARLDALLSRGARVLITPPGWHHDAARGPLLDLLVYE